MKYKPAKHQLAGKYAMFEADVGDFIEMLLAYNKSRDYVGHEFEKDYKHIADAYRYRMLSESYES